MKKLKSLDYVSIFFDGDDFVVAHTDENHPGAYFTDDLEDALDTAKHLDKPEDKPATILVEGFRGRQEPMTKEELTKRWKDHVCQVWWLTTDETEHLYKDMKANLEVIVAAHFEKELIRQNAGA